MNPRIEYIDAAKGLCILLVVAMHLGVPEIFPGAYNMMVPCFFFLSGFFYSTKGGFNYIIRKRAKTLLIPFLFWYLLSYTIFYIGKFIYPNISSMTDATGILDCFTQKGYFNGPLWFLPCLFFINLIAYPILRYINNLLTRLFLVFLVGALGFLLYVYETPLPLAIDTALTATPFFILGHLAKRWALFERIKAPYSIFVSIILYCIYIIHPYGVWMAGNKYQGLDFIGLYTIIGSLSLSIIILLKELTFLGGGLSYFGRNSLVILCTHHLLYRPIRLILLHFHSIQAIEPYINLILTLCLCALLSKFFERHMRWAFGK